MGIKYLLDTNILFELSRNTPNSNVVQKINQHGDQCATAALVIHEINFGIQRLAKGKLKQNLTLFIQQLERYELPVLPYDNHAALYHATERARLVTEGLTPAFIDGQIAAIAVRNELILVSRNTNDFDQFNDLVLENWFLAD